MKHTEQTGPAERLTIHNAPAKVNLNLRITGKRPDGYHLLESDVVFTNFGDELSFQPDHQDSFEITGAYADQLSSTGENNICLQAMRYFRDAGGKIAPIGIRLAKHIPVGAGLGGGSADAAATLRYLNATAQHPLDDGLLHDIATQLGADVPVCLQSTSHHMGGIGEMLTPITNIETTPILLANPGVPLATADVFTDYANTSSPVSHAALATDASRQSPPVSIDDYVGLGNDLAPPAKRLVPQIGQLLNDLAQQEGVTNVAMSGSGASCFALFDGLDGDAACRLAEQKLRQIGYWAVATSII